MLNTSRAFLKAMEKQEEVVPPALNLTAQQLYWVGQGQTFCLLGGFEHVDNFEEILNYQVTGNPLVFVTRFVLRMVLYMPLCHGE